MIYLSEVVSMKWYVEIKPFLCQDFIWISFALFLWFIKNIRSSMSHKKNSVFPELLDFSQNLSSTFIYQLILIKLNLLSCGHFLSLFIYTPLPLIFFYKPTSIEIKHVNQILLNYV